ncbi:MAG: hypothetical protein RMK91_04505 [Pseudanabaenaceae cyanobacterium SKYGB_i_bin29]|nr:hypothetical protein [Pseudanabaenaceae cyanobacterium SKYG29]MDW8421105.1 hypothetical protein [Pseudanabaenaceae cyanobacterium SKYGB_i_bin29]
MTKVLLIDDEPDICDLIKAALEELAKWSVTVCSSSDNVFFSSIRSTLM